MIDKLMFVTKYKQKLHRNEIRGAAASLNSKADVTCSISIQVSLLNIFCSMDLTN